jgi:hypothetical protein
MVREFLQRNSVLHICETRRIIKRPSIGSTTFALLRIRISLMNFGARFALELISNPESPSVDTILPDDLIEVGDDRSIRYIVFLMNGEWVEKGNADHIGNRRRTRPIR